MTPGTGRSPVPGPTSGTTDQRLLGLLVLLATLLTVVVSSRLNTPDISGRAFPTPPPRPAQVGDCVLTPVPASLPYNESGVADPALPLDDCVGERFGEIYAVLDLTTLSPTGKFGECLTTPELGSYLGADSRANEIWIPTWNYSTVVVGPNDLQRRNGQQWAACALVARTGQPAFTTPLRSLYQGGSLPPAFGFCSSTTGIENIESVSCIEPHTVELFGFFEFTDYSATPAQVHQSCLDFVTRQTGIPELAASEGLVVATPTLRDGSTGSTPLTEAIEPGQRGQILCEITAAPGRALTGSLLSLGTGTVPWA